MSVYGALYSAVSGLKAQSTSMGIISDNISNANTVGYKANSAAFSTLVTAPPSRGSYSPGGVLASTVQNIDRQGLLQASASGTDLAITGRGFFATASAVDAAGRVPLGVERLYTRAGSFNVDKSGNLINTAGGYLLGVPVATGADPATVALMPTANLTAINVGSITGSARGTSTISLGANLPATDAVVTLANVRMSNASGGAASNATDATLDIDSTTGGLQTARTTSVLVYDSLGVAHNMELGFFKTSANTWEVFITKMTVAGKVGPTGKPVDSITGTETNSFVDAATGAIGEPLPGAVPATLTGQLGTLNFNTDGSFASFTQGANSVLDQTLGTAGIPLSAAGSTGAANLNPDITYGIAGTKSGITQNSDDFAVAFVNQDGIKFGYRTGVVIDEFGVVRAVFDNGQRLAVAKIPLVNFANVNALQARNGNVYAETDDSGSATTNYAYQGGVGSITPNAVEGSTVDLAEEFSDMIVTQRTYSANARTITTSDEMLAEVINLKR